MAVRGDILMRAFPNTSGGHFTRSVRVCFALPEFLDFPSRGGLGQAYAAFARALAKAGHDVTVLLTETQQQEQTTFEDIEKEGEAMRVKVVLLPELTFRCESSPNGGKHPLVCFRAWRWLKGQNFDVIHFTDWKTAGFYCVSAKRAGMAFQDTLLCVSLRSSSRWCREGDEGLIESFSEMETDYMEQRTAELADLVFVPSEYAANWALEKGWKLPERVYHQPNLIHLPDALAALPPMEGGPIQEIVFFGRLQAKKGFHEFCGALDRMDPTILSRLTISFLGGHGETSSTYLAEKKAQWPCQLRILDMCSRQEALTYLRRPGVLAVIASRCETFSNAAYECQNLGIPLLAANTACLRELVQPEDRDAVLFDLSPQALAAKLVQALAKEPAAFSPKYDPAASQSRWIAWHNDLATNRADFMPVPPSPRDELPLVSVCMTHYNQPELLAKAIASLECQTYQNLEVVLVDDGSSMPFVAAALLEIEQRIAPRGWRVVRQENRYVGAARNEAVRHARGEFLMFMDDDNLAKPHEVETFVRGALHSGLDVVVSMMHIFRGLDDPLDDEDPSQYEHLFLGGPIAGAIFQNTLGDANFFVRASVFRAVGGFAEVHGISGEDTNLLVRLGLAGHEILAIPESLYWYRVRPDSMYRTASKVGRTSLVMSAYDSVASPLLRDALIYARSSHLRVKEGAAADLLPYRTVLENRARDVGVRLTFGIGWHTDERSRCWSGTKEAATLTFRARQSCCRVDFTATLEAAHVGNRLSVAWNGDTILEDFHGGELTLQGLLLKRGDNELRFTPALPPEQATPEDARKLSYAISRIFLTPADLDAPLSAHVNLLKAPLTTTHTVAINELSQIGAVASFGEGWYADEQTHRWAGTCGRRATIVFESRVRRGIRFQADVGWASSNHALTVSFNDTILHRHAQTQKLSLEFTLSPGVPNILTFETEQPPAQPSPQDTRKLSCSLANIGLCLLACGEPEG